MKNKILILGLAVTMLASVAVVGFPAPAQAEGLTSEQIEAIIELANSFNADVNISSLRAALTGTLSSASDSGSSAAWCYTFNNNLRIGSTGPDTIALLTALEKEGFSNRQGQRGVVDEALASSVVGFQEKYRSEILTPNNLQYGTGFVGPSTRAKLNSLYGCNVVRPPTPQPTITVSSPNGGERWARGSSYNITWTSSGLTPADKIDIRVIRAGEGLPYIAMDIPVSAGVYSWTIPNDFSLGDNYIISIYKSIAIPQHVGDSSNSPFTITSPTANQPSITVLSPNDGRESYVSGSQIEVKWNMNYNTASNSIKIYVYSPTRGETLMYSNLSGKVGLNSASISTLPFSSEQYKINVCDDDKSPAGLSGKSLCDLSDNYFTITSPTANQPTISITSPRDYGPYTKGTNLPITWSTTGSVPSVNLDLYSSSGTKISSIASNLSNSGAYTWVIPTTLTDDRYRIRITSASNSSVTVQSVNIDVVSPTITTQPSITVLSPNGEEGWQTGTAQTIKWATNNDSSFDQVQIVIGNSATGIEKQLYDRVSMVGFIAKGQGSFPWNIPSTILSDFSATNYPNSFYIKISGVKNDSVGGQVIVSDRSDSPFTITSPTANQPTATMSVSPSRVAVGENATITWVATNASSCTATGFQTYGATSGSQVVRFTVPVTSTYNLTCTGTGGTASAATTLTVTAVETQPSASITLKRPNGGETYVAGQTIPNITWTAANMPAATTIDNLVFTLGSSNDNATYSLPVVKNSWFAAGFNGYYTNNGSSFLLDMKIPSTVPAGQYKLKISCPSCGGAVGDDSDNIFTIQSSNTSPSLSLTAPAANQNVVAGQPVTINWTSSNVLAPEKITIIFSNSNNTTLGYWAPDTVGVPNTGSYTWTVPAGITLGKYKVQISCADCYRRTGVSTYVWGGEFNVVAPIVSAPPLPVITLSANQMATSDAQPRAYNVIWSATSANSCVLTTNATKDISEDFDFWSGYVGPIQTSGSISNVEVYGSVTVTITCTGSGGTAAKSVILTGNQAAASLSPEMISAMTAFSQQNNLNTANVLRAVEQLMRAFR